MSIDIPQLADDGRAGRSAPRARSSSVVGILGGMGPAASADFYSKLIAATPARIDQEHLRVVMWADPTVPDRSAALMGAGPDPTPWLLSGAEILRRAGANLLAIPCNTAHAFTSSIARDVGLPVVDMIETVADEVCSRRGPGSVVALFATTGLLASGLYQSALAARGMASIVPSADEQELIMEAIGAVKSGRLESRHQRALEGIAARLHGRGASVLVAGCTELPLALPDTGSPLPVLDPNRVLAEAVVSRALAAQDSP